MKNLIKTKWFIYGTYLLLVLATLLIGLSKYFNKHSSCKFIILSMTAKLDNSLIIIKTILHMYDISKKYLKKIKNKPIKLLKEVKYMFNGFYPRYELEARIQHTKLDSWGDFPSARMNRVEEPSTTDFQSVMSGLVEGLNTSMNAPDNLLKDAMMGSENVDIHDVMVAMSKAEIAVNVATTATGKVIQAYDKIMQIQI